MRKGRSKKELPSTDCEDPFDQSSHTVTTKHKAFAAGSKRQRNPETSIRPVRPKPRAGFRLSTAHSRRVHTLHMSRGTERDASEMIGPLLQPLCIQLVRKEVCDKTRQSRSQASAAGLDSPAWLQQTSILRLPTDGRLFVLRMHRRELYVVRRQGKSGELHGVAEHLRRAGPLPGSDNFVSFYFQPCNNSMVISVCTFRSRSSQVGQILALVLRLYIYYNCQHWGLSKSQPSASLGSPWDSFV
jgi:hypothetical protein